MENELKNSSILMGEIWLERLIRAKLERDADLLPQEEKDLIENMLADSALKQMVIEYHMLAEFDIDEFIRAAENAAPPRRKRQTQKSEENGC